MGMITTGKRDPVTGAILGLIGLPGLPAIAFTSPATFQTLGLSAKDKWRHQKKYYINQVVAKLAKKGLIEFKLNSRNVKCARLTNKGRAELKRYELKQLTIAKPKRWDGKYRLVIFDIKEWKRGVRDQVRHWLEHLGFVRLQNSVWVYPYECQAVVALLKSNFRIGREVLYLTVESIENDRWLRKEFNLPD